MKKCILFLTAILVFYFASLVICADEKPVKAKPQKSQAAKTVKTADPKTGKVVTTYRYPTRSDSPSSLEAVNRLLGVRSSDTAISPPASAYLYPNSSSAGQSARSPIYGSLYGRPQHSQYESVTSRIRKQQLRRNPSVYNNPNATHIFYPRSVGIR